MWTHRYKRNHSCRSMAWTKLNQLGFWSNPWGSGVFSPHCMKTGSPGRTLHSKKHRQRDTSSPEVPNTNFLYENKARSSLMSKVLYNDKVYSSQMLCIFLTEPWFLLPPSPYLQSVTSCAFLLNICILILAELKLLTGNIEYFIYYLLFFMEINPVIIIFPLSFFSLQKRAEPFPQSCSPLTTLSSPVFHICPVNVIRWNFDR